MVDAGDAGGAVLRYTVRMTPTLPSGVSLDEGRGGLPRLIVITEACTAELYLQGAHLCHWKPEGQAHPVLWMSQASRFEAGAAIRGGVPVCFPWFGPKAGDPSAPVHGVARIRPWVLNDAAAGPDGSVDLRLSLRSDESTRGLATHDFTLEFALRLGPTLSMALTITNSGDSPLTCEEALHTYLTVGDVRQVSVEGLAGATYIDKTDGARRKTQTDEVVTIGAETDRLYVDTTSTVTLVDPGLGRRISVVKDGSRSSVVWNPWVAKSRAMPDFGDDEWRGMLCIETANAADNAVTIPPHASHTMTAVISVTAI